MHHIGRSGPKIVQVANGNDAPELPWLFQEFICQRASVGRS